MNDIYTPKNDPFRDARIDFETTVDLRPAELLDVDFDKYISPIMLSIRHGVDNAVMGAVVEVGVSVHKQELEKALRYDRDQYAAGYRAGKEAAAPKWISTNTPPKFTSDYLVYVWVSYPDGISGMEMRTANYNTVRKEWTVNHGRLEAIGCPSHWMPLPEAPKEVE